MTCNFGGIGAETVTRRPLILVKIPRKLFVIVNNEKRYRFDKRPGRNNKRMNPLNFMSVITDHSLDSSINRSAFLTFNQLEKITARHEKDARHFIE